MTWYRGGLEVAKEYALYKGDELLVIGTVNEIAEEMGIAVSTVYFYKSKAYQSRSKKEYSNRRVLVPLDD